MTHPNPNAAPNPQQPNPPTASPQPSNPQPAAPQPLVPQPATAQQAPALARLIATAFAPMPIVAWLIPPPGDRVTILARYFRILVEHATTIGHVDVLPDRTAVAVWLPAGQPDLPTITDYPARRAAACGPYTDRFTQLDHVMHTHHPTSPPHDHLAFLAVRPTRHNTGLGSLLLAHRHRLLDHTARPAYLEASTMRSARLYQRHGYHHHAAPFAPTNCTPTMWPMWRDPQPAPRRVHGGTLGPTGE